MDVSSVKRMGRRNKGWTQFFPFLISIQYSNTCYCDGSVGKKEASLVSFATWSAKDFSFAKKTLSLEEAREVVSMAGIRKAKYLIDVDVAEMAALILANQTYPDQRLFSDSRKSVKLAQKIGISAEWIPRELNTLADYIASNHCEGNGHIAFNKLEIDRGWIDLVID